MRDATSELLRIHLSCAVPLQIAEMQQRPNILRALLGQREGLTALLGTFGEGVSFKTPETRAMISLLTQALAALAFQPGGVTFLGLHFQVKEDTTHATPSIGTACDLPASISDVRQGKLWNL